MADSLLDILGMSSQDTSEQARKEDFVRNLKQAELSKATGASALGITEGFGAGSIMRQREGMSKLQDRVSRATGTGAHRAPALMKQAMENVKAKGFSIQKDKGKWLDAMLAETSTHPELAKQTFVFSQALSEHQASQLDAKVKRAELGIKLNQEGRDTEMHQANLIEKRMKHVLDQIKQIRDLKEIDRLEHQITQEATKARYADPMARLEISSQMLALEQQRMALLNDDLALRTASQKLAQEEETTRNMLATAGPEAKAALEKKLLEIEKLKRELEGPSEIFREIENLDIPENEKEIRRRAAVDAEIAKGKGGISLAIGPEGTYLTTGDATPIKIGSLSGGPAATLALRRDAVIDGINMVGDVLGTTNDNLGLYGVLKRWTSEAGNIAKDLSIHAPGIGKVVQSAIQQFQADAAAGLIDGADSSALGFQDGYDINELTLPQIENSLAYILARAREPDSRLTNLHIQQAKKDVELTGFKGSDTVRARLNNIRKQFISAGKRLNDRLNTKDGKYYKEIDWNKIGSGGRDSNKVIKTLDISAYPEDKQKQLNQIRPGSVIETPDGLMYRKLGDGRWQQISQ